MIVDIIRANDTHNRKHFRAETRNSEFPCDDARSLEDILSERRIERSLERRKKEGKSMAEERAKGNEESLNFSALKIAWNSSLAKSFGFCQFEGCFHKVDRSGISRRWRGARPEVKSSKYLVEAFGERPGKNCYSRR